MNGVSDTICLSRNISGEISARQSSTSTQGLDGQVVHLLALAILQHANNHGENKQLEKERSM
jgi:hypothetical protein